MVTYIQLLSLTVACCSLSAVHTPTTSCNLVVEGCLESFKDPKCMDQPCLGLLHPARQVRRPASGRQNGLLICFPLGSLVSCYSWILPILSADLCLFKVSQHYLQSLPSDHPLNCEPQSSPSCLTCFTSSTIGLHRWYEEGKSLASAGMPKFVQTSRQPGRA